MNSVFFSFSWTDILNENEVKNHLCSALGGFGRMGQTHVKIMHSPYRSELLPWQI